MIENYFEKKIQIKTISYSETCLNRTLNKPKSCIHRILNKVLMQEIFVNLTCINWILSIPNTKVNPKEVQFRQVSLYMECKLTANNIEWSLSTLSSSYRIGGKTDIVGNIAGIKILYNKRRRGYSCSTIFGSVWCINGNSIISRCKFLPVNWCCSWICYNSTLNGNGLTIVCSGGGSGQSDTWFIWK